MASFQIDQSEYKLLCEAQMTAPPPTVLPYFDWPVEVEAIRMLSTNQKLCPSGNGAIRSTVIETVSSFFDLMFQEAKLLRYKKTKLYKIPNFGILLTAAA